MSRHRNQLRALVALGTKPEQIASEVPMHLRNVVATLQEDWPIPKRFVSAFEAYAQRTLRQAHATATGLEKAALACFYVDSFGIPIEHPPVLDSEARRATYVAWLLRVPPDAIFPLGPECNQEANEHLAFWMRQHVEQLLAEAKQAVDRSPEALRYLSTLGHADDVLGGRSDPADNGWFENLRGYRRGGYVFLPGAAARRRTAK
jgi:hypothetical protein